MKTAGSFSVKGGALSGGQSQGLIRYGANLIGGKWFGQVINGSHPGAFDRRFNAGLAGNDNDLGLRIMSAHGR